MVQIDLDHVSLTFRVRKHGRTSVKDLLVREIFRGPSSPIIKVRALRDVCLRIEQGERVGIIGANGAGKTSLLKLLAGVYPPTRGTRNVSGRISSLFDLALGFEYDASGWDNIYYRGYLQGETPRSVRSKIQQIAEYSELGDFLNMPVRYYSAGMVVRLAFSIATAVEPEILLVDEVLSVGDMAFQHKARQRMCDMMGQARLIVMVSHEMKSLARLCERGVWLDHGQVVQSGPIDDVIAAYTAHVQAAQPQAA
jgi:ABC-type polysaccharide/polyol phosphate transport system ATPase subunit